MQICHIASHKGNVGDLINHQGFYNNMLPAEVSANIERIELRDFYYSYNQRRVFDEHLARQLNKCNLVVIGGGGYLDAQWPESETGTTLSLSRQFIDSLSTKVLVNAIGYHEYPGRTNASICRKFSSFLGYVSQLDNWMVTVRNDGSYERLAFRYGETALHNIKKVPDNGFFCDLQKRLYLPKDRTVGMCITNDLFCAEYNKGVQAVNFNQYISTIINELCSIGYRIVLLPHTPPDIEIVGKLYSHISSQYKREKLVVAPLDANTSSAINRLNEYYNLCSCIIGMRFHSLICAINLGIPAIALAGHEQIEGLYRELSLSDYCVRVDNLSFRDKLFSMVDKCVSKSELIHARYTDFYKKMNIEETSYKSTLLKFLQA